MAPHSSTLAWTRMVASSLPHFYSNPHSEIRSVMSDSLQPRGLYSPWNSPGQNTGVGAFSFSRGSSQPRDQTQVSLIAGGFFTG